MGMVRTLDSSVLSGPSSKWLLVNDPLKILTIIS